MFPVAVKVDVPYTDNVMDVVYPPSARRLSPLAVKLDEVIENVPPTTDDAAAMLWLVVLRSVVAATETSGLPSIAPSAPMLASDDVIDEEVP